MLVPRISPLTHSLPWRAPHNAYSKAIVRAMLACLRAS